jgi:phosphoadenosine phosphosulfate reductase
MEINITLEEALQKSTPPLRVKILHSVELLRKAEKLALLYDKENGFWTGFSGGKDSQAVYHMAQLAGVKHKGFFSPTSVDPPELIRFIREQYPEVEFTKITKSIYQEFIKRKCLPSMKIRWCCAEFKEKGGENKVVLVGVRHEESLKRSKRKEVEVSSHKFSGDIESFNEWSKKRRARKSKDKNFDQFSEHKEQMVTCINGHDKIVVSPIIDWTEHDVWEFLNKVVEVPHCKLYDEGYHRIGCICCPMANMKNTIRDIKRYPHVKENWIKAIMEVRRQGVTENTPPPKPNIYQQPRQWKPLPTDRLFAATDGPLDGRNGAAVSTPPQRKLTGIWSGNF